MLSGPQLEQRLSVLQVRLCTFNLWLIPFKGPWFLGRAASRCIPALVSVQNRLAALAPTGQAKVSQHRVLRLALVFDTELVFRM